MEEKIQRLEIMQQQHREKEIEKDKENIAVNHIEDYLGNVNPSRSLKKGTIKKV